MPIYRKLKTENASLQIHPSFSSVSVLRLWIQDRIKVRKSKTRHLGPTPTGKIASCCIHTVNATSDIANSRRQQRETGS